MGAVVAEKLIESEEDNPGNYVMIASLQDRNSVHILVAGDTNDESSCEIYATTASLNSHMAVRAFAFALMSVCCVFLLYRERDRMLIENDERARDRERRRKLNLGMKIFLLQE